MKKHLLSFFLTVIVHTSNAQWQVIGNSQGSSLFGSIFRRLTRCRNPQTHLVAHFARHYFAHPTGEVGGKVRQYLDPGRFALARVDR